MFCKNCGSQLPDGVAFCTACGTPVSVAPQPPVAPQAPVMPQPPVAPQPPMPNAYVAPVTAMPPQPPVTNPMYAPVIPEPEQKKKGGAFKIIAIIAAAAILLGGLVWLACSLFLPTAEGAVKKYITASEFEYDMKAAYSVMAGDAKKYVEDHAIENEDVDEEFEDVEEACHEEGIDIDIDNFNDFYKAMKKLTAIENADCFGEDYEVTVLCLDEIDMDYDVLEAYREVLDDPTCSDYIDINKIEDGKFIVAKLNVTGRKDEFSELYVVPLVKYGLKWKVLEVGLYLQDEDYDYTAEKFDAIVTINEETRKIEYDAESQYDYEDNYYYDNY